MTQNLWSKITATSALEHAWDKVRRNKGAAGGDGISTRQYGNRIKFRLASLSKALATGDFDHGPCKRIDIPKRQGGLRRLTIPPVEDRIVHTAIANVLTPILEPQFEESSFAYRPGRSVQQAVSAIEKWRNEGYCHVIEADIVNYFDNIGHATLLATLNRHLTGFTDIQALMDFLADALEHQATELGTNGKGLVQGSPLSPLLANLYLDVLDEEMRGKGIRIVRFADDFVILCKSSKYLDAAFEELQHVLTAIGLKLHPGKTRSIDFDRGFEFLGYLFVRSLAMPKKDFHGVAEANARPVNQTRPAVRVKPEQEPVKIEHSAPEWETQDSELSTETNSTDTEKSTRYASGERILYVLENGRSLTIQNQSLIISDMEDNTLLAINANKVDRIELGANTKIDQSVIDHCLDGDTRLVFLNGYGESRGRLIANEDRYPALQFMQATACADQEFASNLSRKIVDARIRNQRTQLFRLNRHRDLDDVHLALERMGRHLRKLDYTKDVDQLRGLEGACGAEYWPALGRLCKGIEPPFRRTRPAKNALNAAINFMTAILLRDIRGAVRSAGLHVGFGFLHKPHDYSEAAIYDLMEPFRAPLSEGLPVHLFNARRLREEMFENREDGSIRMDRQARRAIITGYEQAVAKRVNKPAVSGKLAWRPMMRFQALSLAKAYRKKDHELFTPYLMEA